MKRMMMAALVSLCFAFGASAQSPVSKFLKNIYGAEVTKLDSKVFKEYYQVMLPQLLDHEQPNGKRFRQRIFIGFMDQSAVTVMETDGYAFTRAENPNFQDEPQKMFGGNVIYVEHRYFAKSVPDSLDYRFLTMDEACADYHYIRETLGVLFTGKWIGTGISKGGQMATAWKMYYPKDVDLTIAYVAPLNMGLEDARIYHHFETVGDASTRKKIDAYQKKLLKNRKEYLPLFDTACAKKHVQFTLFSPEEVYYLCVLEYEFSFWQWHGDPKEIPAPNSDAKAMLTELFTVIPPDYFTMPGMADYYSAMYQNFTQLGYYEYNYEIPQFKKYLVLKNYSNAQLAQPGIKMVFDSSYIHSMRNFIASKPAHMIYVYGQLDPWGSTGIDLTNNPNSIKEIVAGGTHRSRIRNLSDVQKKEVYDAIHDWLGITPAPVN